MTILSVSMIAVGPSVNASLLARHFVSIDHARIEAILKGFSRVAQTKGHLGIYEYDPHDSTQSHLDPVSAQNVRFIYEPLINNNETTGKTPRDQIYCVLITDKQIGNPIADVQLLESLLDAIRSRIFPSGGKNESKITESIESAMQIIDEVALDIILTFDEVVLWGGNAVGICGSDQASSITRILAMESASEEKQNAVDKLKEQDAKEASKLRQRARLMDQVKNAANSPDGSAVKRTFSAVSSMFASFTGKSSGQNVPVPMSPTSEQPTKVYYDFEDEEQEDRISNSSPNSSKIAQPAMKLGGSKLSKSWN